MSPLKPSCLGQITEDAFLGGKLSLFQPAKGGHRAGLDALLLAATIPRGAEGLLIELGAGVGLAALAVALREPKIEAVLVEQETVAAALARENIMRNQEIVSRCHMVQADVRNLLKRGDPSGLAANSARYVILNPPFHACDRMRPSPYSTRAGAHFGEAADLGDWLRAAARLVRPKGLLALIHRADELHRILPEMARFGAITLRPVHPREGAPAIRVLITAHVQSKAPLKLLPGLVLHEEDGRWRKEVATILNGASFDN